MMKKLIVAILFLFISISVFAQHDRNKFKELKIPFISERLNLTSAEAEKFWPIYNEYDDISSDLRHKIRGIQHRIKRDAKTFSNEEAKELLYNLNDYESKMVVIDKKLINDLLTILPPTKVLQLKAAEEEFKKMLFEKYVRKKLDSEKQ